MQLRTRTRNAVTAAVTGLAALAASAAVADTFVVTPTQTYGWTFAQDNATPGGTAFVDGPGTPPMGTGSAQLTANLATDGPILFKADYMGTKLSDISTLQYSTYRTTPTDPNSVLAIALQFNVDSDITDANNSFQGRLVFEPYQGQAAGTVVPGSWQTWNALQGKWWGSGGGPTRPISAACPQSNPCTLAQIISMFPNAGIHGTQGAVVFKAGSGWTGFDGNVDAFTIGVSGVNDTYDFNLHSTPTDKDQCKNGGFKNFNPPSGPYKNQGQCVSATNQQ
jgi:hypothetical protein